MICQKKEGGKCDIGLFLRLPQFSIIHLLTQVLFPCQIIYDDRLKNSYQIQKFSGPCGWGGVWPWGIGVLPPPPLCTCMLMDPNYCYKIS